MTYTAIYLTALAVVWWVAVFNRPATIFAVWMAADFFGTMILQDRVAFHQMIMVDATLFSIMGILCACDPKRWKIVAAGFIGLSVLAHVAYYGMGDSRFDFSRIHMYVEQWLFFFAMAALAVGDNNVFQRLLDRWSQHRRGLGNNDAGAIWARSGVYSPLPEETT